MEPIELLMSEHRVIETVLDSLEAYGAAVGRSEDYDSGRLSDYVTFLRGYADAIHHGKEEQILYARLKQHGVPDHLAPGIMGNCREHDISRLLVDDLSSAARRADPWTEEQRHLIQRKIVDYVSLLRRHIVDEDDDLFPKIAEALPEGAMQEVAAACEGFESQNAQKRDELRALAEHLAGS